jgi:tellurite resistance protein TerC
MSVNGTFLLACFLLLLLSSAPAPVFCSCPFRLLPANADAILLLFMDAIGGNTWLWLGFSLFILTMLSLDLGLFNRKAHTIKYREAWIWSGVWVTLALCFAAIVFHYQGSQRGLEFLTGYLIELSLSVDNLFVFLLIFSYFKVPSKFQHRVLFWGVMGALFMRLTMIFVGAALINRFHWIIYIFGGFLVYTGLKMFRHEEIDIQPEQNILVRAATHVLPISRHYEEEKFFTRTNGKRSGTLLLLVLMVVEVTDLVFAVDSIPAIFAITTNTFIVYTSNVFAILGLRSMYFLLAGVVEKFRYLRFGLAIVLTFIGLKMLVVIFGFQIPILFSLGFVAVILLGSVVASLLIEPEGESTIQVDLPPDFDLPDFTLPDVQPPTEDSTEAQDLHDLQKK